MKKAIHRGTVEEGDVQKRGQPPLSAPPRPSPKPPPPPPPKRP